MPKFIVQSGAEPGTEISGDRNRVLFGRADDCDVIIPDVNVSRHHAQAVLLDGLMALVDLNSSNGTFVNGLPISRIFLMDGDVVTLGETQLVFVDDDRTHRELALNVPAMAPRLRVSDLEGSASADAESQVQHTQLFASIPEDMQAEALKDIYQKLKALYRIFLEVADAPSLKEIFEVVGRAITVSTAGERAIFFLYAETTGEGWQRYLMQTSVRIDEEAAKRAECEDLLNRARKDQRIVLARVDRKGTAVFGDAAPNAMAVPLYRGTKLATVIYVDKPASESPFSKNDVDFITTVGVQVGTRLNQFEQVLQLKQENVKLRQKIDEDFVVITNNEAMKLVMENTQRVAESDTTVLITGESGTGKELIARSIHHFSRRRTKQLVAVNCAALTETLLESELFGHEKGAFTGAFERHIGKFEVADNGTLFLDELAEISPSAQAKILRVLQEGEIQRVGGNKVIKVNVRVIAATNKNLADEVARGAFRKDLYYRLRVIELDLPPLRERRDDIPVLAQYFLKQLRLKVATSVQSISPEAIEMLARYHYPGNIRELRNIIERGLVFARGDAMLPEHLPPEVSTAAGITAAPQVLSGGEFPPAGSFAASPAAGGEAMGGPVVIPSETLQVAREALGPDGEPLPLSEMEKRHIHFVLHHAGGNKLRAASILGISRTTLYEKLKVYGTVNDTEA